MEEVEAAEEEKQPLRLNYRPRLDLVAVVLVLEQLLQVVRQRPEEVATELL